MELRSEILLSVLLHQLDSWEVQDHEYMEELTHYRFNSESLCKLVGYE